MKSVLLIALLLLATKKLGDFVLSFFCLLVLGYGVYLLTRRNPTSEAFRGVTSSRRA